MLVRGFGVQSDRTKLPQKGDREKNILMSLAFLKEAVNDVFDYLDNLERSSVTGDSGRRKAGLRLVMSDE